MPATDTVATDTAATGAASADGQQDAARTPLPLFQNYTQMEQPLPMAGWYALRVLTVAGMLGLAALLVADPERGLAALWGLAVPVLPLVWLVAPGLWRNVCPLAASNQTPRVAGFSRAGATPAWFRRYQYAFGVTLFVLLATTRKVLFNTSGLASALLLLSVLVAAFVGGVLFKGKSGWCSSICPLLPVQRLYGQTPFATIPNAHCQPCVGCTKNCYDFNPGAAQLADLGDDDEEYAGFRRTFAGLFPGLVVGFFTIPNAAEIGVLPVYGRMGLALLVSLGAYNALRALLVRQTVLLTAAFGGMGITLFYGYGLPKVGDALDLLFGIGLTDGVIWAGRVAVGALVLVWLARTWQRERQFLAREAAGAATVAGGAAVLARVAGEADGPEVTFQPDGVRTVATAGEPLLKVAERSEVHLDPGCRMGVCGADPVAVLEGADNLSEMEDDERSTLDRLGLLGGCRMACVARVDGPVTVSADTSLATSAPTSSSSVAHDPDVRRVVVLGNGIAGVTAADHARRVHPDCEIHLVSREAHHLYNRMGISRLVYGRSAMHGLYLNPDSWYDERDITLWLNTQATSIDRSSKQVALATGESLPYDRLVLAMGARAFVPDVDGWGLAGTFALREAEDATGIRAHVQGARATRAVVAGGGLLGLEAAYALSKLGLETFVIEMGDRLLRRQLDAGSSALLQAYLEGLGLRIVTEDLVVAAAGESRLQEVRLKSGASIAADVLVVAAGVRSNIQLAVEAGLDADMGVVVDDHCRTQDPSILAAGDVCQHAGRFYGLWPAAVDQARVAGRNAVLPSEAQEEYGGTVAVTMLKVAGIDLVSMGRVFEEDDDEVIVAEDHAAQRYLKLVVAQDGTLAGAILLGHPEWNQLVSAAVKRGQDVGDVVDRLRELDLAVLERRPVDA